MTPPTRPDWPIYFMDIARLVATRSTCLRRQVGAVIVKNRNILATGYNGTPTGLRHCSETGCLREKHQVPSGQRHELCRGLHAEQNAIIQAAKHGVSIEGADIFINFSPCSFCAKSLVNIQIRTIYCADGYPDDLAMEILNEANIPIENLPR